MIIKDNKPILFFYVSCKLQIWEIALVIINIKTHKRECENTMFIFIFFFTRSLAEPERSGEPRLRKDPRHLTTLWAFTACYRDSFNF
jgi:hypothetical protein